MDTLTDPRPALWALRRAETDRLAMLRIARTAICGCPVAAIKTVAWGWIIDPNVRGAHR